MSATSDWFKLAMTPDSTNTHFQEPPEMGILKNMGTVRTSDRTRDFGTLFSSRTWKTRI